MIGATRTLALLAVLAVAPACWGWGLQGHATTAAIADRLLNPRAKAAVAELLQDDLDAAGNPSHRTTLESVASWPDEIRNTPASHQPWHYDNIPICGPPDKSTYCPNGECATEQMPRLVQVLGNAQASRRERNEALKWVVHIVGDIHQPLHAGSNLDRGGTQVQVALAGRKTHGNLVLHGVWDTEFVQVALGMKTAGPVPPEIDALTRQAAAMARVQGQGNIESWAAESLQLAHEHAYRYPEFACGVIPAKILVLSESYQDEAASVDRNRVLVGGARLGNLLNETLGGP